MLVILIALFPFHMFAQRDWGVGIRLGDPTGVTIKKYKFASALEFSVGRTHWLFGNGWYSRRFDEWYAEQNFGYKNFQYVRHHASFPLGVQMHYLIQKDIRDVSGLEWYYGVGGQFRFQTFTYHYRYKLENGPQWIYATGGTVTDVSLGPDAVIGLEYTFEDLPISLFLDVTLFMEVVDDPFLFWFQGGIGARYNF